MPQFQLTGKRQRAYKKKLQYFDAIPQQNTFATINFMPIF